MRGAITPMATEDQMTVLDAHIAHHKHVQALYEELLKDVKGVHIHKQPADPRYGANLTIVFLCHDSAEASSELVPLLSLLNRFMLGKKVECRPVWKPMHKQPVYAENDVYTNGVEEELFKVGFCLPAGPYVTDEDVHYIVDCIREAIS